MYDKCNRYHKVVMMDRLCCECLSGSLHRYPREQHAEDRRQRLMCIRDRATAAEPCGCLPEIRSIHCTIGLRIMTVTYTHLRAHEIVLEIVCRLMLEKKKTYCFTIPLISPITK